MPRVTSIEMFERNEQPTISIRRTCVNVNNMPEIIGSAYAKLGAYLKEQGELMSDMPFVAYHNMDMENLDVEIGFQVAKALPGKNDIQSAVIPAGKVVMCIFRGAYNEIESTYEEMAKYVTDSALTHAGAAYEYYYNSPQDFPMDEMLTQIEMPVY